MASVSQGSVLFVHRNYITAGENELHVLRTRQRNPIRWSPCASRWPNNVRWFRCSEMACVVERAGNQFNAARSRCDIAFINGYASAEACTNWTVVHWNWTSAVALIPCFVFIQQVGVYDPYSDDPQLGIQKIALCCASETLFVAGTAGQVVVLQFEEQDRRREIQVTPCVHLVVVDANKFGYLGGGVIQMSLNSCSAADNFCFNLDWVFREPMTWSYRLVFKVDINLRVRPTAQRWGKLVIDILR